MTLAVDAAAHGVVVAAVCRQDEIDFDVVETPHVGHHGRAVTALCSAMARHIFGAVGKRHLRSSKRTSGRGCRFITRDTGPGKLGAFRLYSARQEISAEQGIVARELDIVKRD